MAGVLIGWVQVQTPVFITDTAGDKHKLCTLVITNLLSKEDYPKSEFVVHRNLLSEISSYGGYLIRKGFFVIQGSESSVLECTL